MVSVAGGSEVVDPLVPEAGFALKEKVADPKSGAAATPPSGTRNLCESFFAKVIITMLLQVQRHYVGEL